MSRDAKVFVTIAAALLWFVWGAAFAAEHFARLLAWWVFPATFTVLFAGAAAIVFAGIKWEAQ